MKFPPVLTILFILMVNQTGSAQTLTLPLRLDYELIRKVVSEQLYTGNNDSAKIWQDKHDCSYLKLSNPKVAGQEGLIKLTNDVTAQIGTPLGGQCLPLMKWTGLFETLQRPTLSQDHAVLSLPVVKAMAYDQQGKPLDIAQLQELIKTVAEPKLTGLKIDLNKSRADLQRTLSRYVKQESADDLKAMLASLRFNKIAAEDAGIVVELAFNPPAKPKPLPRTAPFTANEQRQWRDLWHEWRGFLSKTIEQASQDSDSDAVRKSLSSILQDIDQAFNAGVSHQTDRGGDPVRLLFTRTWERLSPLLRELSTQLPEAKALQYLTFISATDVIYQLDAIASPFGLGISSDGLRNLVRLLIAQQQPATDDPS